jgi:hypothetical protein
MEQPLEVIALDGMPLAYHDPENPKRTVDHLLIAPAGRVDGIVTGPRWELMRRYAHSAWTLVVMAMQILRWY